MADVPLWAAIGGSAVALTNTGLLAGIFLRLGTALERTDDNSDRLDKHDNRILEIERETLT